MVGLRDEDVVPVVLVVLVVPVVPVVPVVLADGQHEDPEDGDAADLDQGRYSPGPAGGG